MRILKIVGIVALCILCLAWMVRLNVPFAKAQYGAGQGDFSAGDYPRAAHHFRIAALLGEETDYKQALCDYHMGDLKTAESKLRRLRDWPEAMVALGVVLMAENHDLEAERIFRSEINRTAHRTYHDKALAWYNLNLLLRQRGNLNGANEALREAMKWSNGESAGWSGPQAHYPRPARTDTK